MVVKIAAVKYSGSKQLWLPRNLPPIQDGANNRVVTYWYNNKHVKLFLFLFGPVNLHSDSWILQLKKSEWLVG